MKTTTLLLLLTASALAASAQTSAKTTAPTAKSEATGKATNSAPTHVFVELPPDIQCSLNNVFGSVEFTHDGPKKSTVVGSVTCLISGSDPGTAKEIPLASNKVSSTTAPPMGVMTATSGLTSPTLATKRFGILRIKFAEKATDSDIIYIEKDKVKLLREFLQTTAKQTAPGAPAPALPK